MKAQREVRAESRDAGDWITAKDGSRHFLRVWTAAGEGPVLLYLHGIEGHSLWFESTAQYLRAQGISTMALDRRGSGMSEEPRGRMKNWKQLLQDLREALDYCREKSKGRPLFLMANCWGAKLAALIASEKAGLHTPFNGLILSSPAIEVKVDLSFRQKLLTAWRYITGDESPIRIPLSVEDFTDNPEYLTFIREDPLRLQEASARFFVNTLILTIKSKRTAEDISCPALIFQSGRDSVVDESGVQKWFERLSSRDKQMHVFAEAFHSLDFDSKPEEYRRLLSEWIIEHSKKPGSE